MKFGIPELVFVAILVAVLGATYALVDKKAASRAKVEQTIAARQKDLADLDRATAGISDVSAKIDELQKAIAFFEGKLPQEKEIDKVLREVWQMAEANQLTIKTIKTLKSERSAGYSEQPIEMSMSGDFKESFYAFMLKLEQLPRLTRVSKMELKKINDRDGQMEASLTLSIFFEPETGMRPTASTN
jgi:type IV pilus assembly protein PilO